MNPKYRISHLLYIGLACAFAIVVLVQVFLIGLALFDGNPGNFHIHLLLGHWSGVAPALMVLLAYTGRLPRELKNLTWLNLVLYILLADVLVFLRGPAPFVAALHPVVAVALFSLSGYLGLRVRQLVRAEIAPAIQPQAAVQPAE